MIAVVLGVLLAIFGLYQRTISMRTLRQVDELLDQAIAGKNLPAEYSESYTSKITEKLRTFLQSKQLNQAKTQQERDSVSELIANIAHQTKTPLTNISMYSQLLLEQNHNPDTKGLTKEIANQSEKLTFFVENLVKTSYLENELIQVHKQEQSFAELVDAAIEGIRLTASQKEIVIRQNVDQQIKGMFDPRWSQEALNNLLENAIKYSEHDTTVTVSLENLESFYKLIVTDQGKGIAEAEQGRIFERFYRGKAALKEDGLGIGLFLVRKIMSMQNGFVKVDSQLSMGATFSLYFPK